MDWWPETSMQQLRRANGWCPNDGAPGINHERGDRTAMVEHPEIAPPAAPLPINDFGLGVLIEANRAALAKLDATLAGLHSEHSEDRIGFTPAGTDDAARAAVEGRQPDECAAYEAKVEAA